MKEQENNYRINDQMDEMHAEKKAMEENKAEYDKCMKVRIDVGEKKYFKMSLKCM